jgi:hypothetical protein
LKIRKEKRDQQIKKRRQGQPVMQVEIATGISLSDNSSTNISRLLLMLSPNSSDEEKIVATKALRRMSSQERAPPLKDLVDAGAHHYFVENLTHHDWRLAFESAWVLTNIASSSFTSDVASAGAIKPLVALLNHTQPDVREQSAWCLGNIAGDSESLRDRVLSAGAFDPL